MSKTAGSGTTEIRAHPYNFGTMEILTGTLSVGHGSATGNSEGTFDISAGAHLDLHDTQTLLATSVITGAGSLSYSAGGVTEIQGTVGVGGRLTVSGGTLRFNTGSVTLSGLTLSGGVSTVNSPLGVTGTFLHSGGTLNGVDTLSVAGLMTWTAGEVRLSHGATLTNNSVFDIQTDENLRYYTGNLSTFINNGTVSKTAGTAATNIGAHMVTSGTIGVSAGQLTFGQTYFQTTPGILSVRIGGPTPVADFDQYPVSQATTLAGTLEIALVNAYTPGLGETFEIMTFASRTGTFGSMQGLDIGNGTHFEVTYNANYVVLTVVSD